MNKTNQETWRSDYNRKTDKKQDKKQHDKVILSAQTDVAQSRQNQIEWAALCYNFNYQTKTNRTQSVKMEEPY